MESDILLHCLVQQKEALGYTNAMIAEMSGVPESTVTKVLNGANRSPGFETISPIARVLGVSLDELSVKETAPPDTSTLTVGVSHIISIYERRLREKNRWINILAVAVAALILLLIFFLIYDITHSSLGWVQYTAIPGNIVSEFIKTANW
nr:MAG TPA: Helix-turn-helix XRE-family like protein [Podoviridae sp. ctJ6o53]